MFTSGLQEEILWSASMPCVLKADDDIPLADYGDSNLGRLKKTYRSGLGYRYGRGMQTICAVHYNFSFPESFLDWLHAAEQSSETVDRIPQPAILRPDAQLQALLMVANVPVRRIARGLQFLFEGQTTFAYRPSMKVRALPAQCHFS